MANLKSIQCLMYLIISITLVSCLQIAGKTCLAMSRKLEFDNYVLTEENFRIQAIHSIHRPECVHQCLRYGKECAGVAVNEALQDCWLLKCSMNLRLLQKGLLGVSNGWNYYANDNACSPGWDPYNGHCYLYGNSERQTWSGALSRCNDHGGYLVRIDSEDENTWLTNYYPLDEMIVTDTSVDRPYKFAVWIGAVSSTPTGVYKWGHTGPKLAYQNWSPENPSDSVGELCGTLLASGMWNNIGCGHSFFFVCERE